MLKNIAGLILIVLVLTSCSHIRKPAFIQNRDTQYLTAKSIPPLRIPPGISSEKFSNYYPVPDRAYPNKSKNVSIDPPGLFD